MKYRVLKSEESYTFSKLAELPFDLDEILADLGCTLETQDLSLPRATDTRRLANLLQDLAESEAIMAGLSEQSRRQLLILPVLKNVCLQINQRLRIEYTLIISNWLRGTLDYYIQSPQNLLVVEAKRDDVEGAIVQLGAELLALDQRESELEVEVLRGAVSTGRLWRFAELHRATKRFIEDKTIYRIPNETEEIFSILVGVFVDKTSEV